MKKGFLTSLLLFGFFFGAGNLIFPPKLGYYAGEFFLPTIFAFILSGVGIPVLTLVLGSMNTEGFIQEIQSKTSRLFSLVYLVALYLAIGPFLAIPRNAIVAFDLGIAPAVDAFSPENKQLFFLAFLALYFVLSALIAINPSKLLQRIGTILTPLFTLLIIALVVLGIFKYGSLPPTPAPEAYRVSPFGTGFLEGYNTLDALASVAFCLVAINTFKQLGFRSKKEYTTTLIGIALFTTLGFSLLYFGLAKLGNHFPIPQDLLASENFNLGAYVLTKSATEIFGWGGLLFLGITVTITCFTTTVGLVSSISDFFVQSFGKLSYQAYVYLFSFIGFLGASAGLSYILKISIPVLLLLYPITIMLVLLVLLNKFFALSKKGMYLGVALVSLVALIEVLASTFQLEQVSALLKHLPFSSLGLSFALPLFIGVLLSFVLKDKQKGAALDFSAFASH